LVHGGHLRSNRIVRCRYDATFLTAWVIIGCSKQSHG
jgi:hypothetical protein